MYLTPGLQPLSHPRLPIRGLVYALYLVQGVASSPFLILLSSQPAVIIIPLNSYPGPHCTEKETLLGSWL